MFSPKAMIHLDNLAYNYRLIKKQLNNIPIMCLHVILEVDLRIKSMNPRIHNES